MALYKMYLLLLLNKNLHIICGPDHTDLLYTIQILNNFCMAADIFVIKCVFHSIVFVETSQFRGRFVYQVHD